MPDDETDATAGDQEAAEAGSGADAEGEGEGEERQGLLDRMRGMGVGTEDPNIVGDAGPTDVPPGHDPPAGP